MENNGNYNRNKLFTLVLVFISTIILSLIILSYFASQKNQNSEKKVARIGEVEVVLPTTIPMNTSTPKKTIKELPTSVPVPRKINRVEVFRNTSVYKNDFYSLGVPLGWSYKLCDINYAEVKDIHSKTNILYINDEREDISKFTCNDLSGRTNQNRHPDGFFVASFEIAKSDYLGDIEDCVSEKKYFGVNNYLGTIIYIGQTLANSDPGSCIYTGGTMRTELYYPTKNIEIGKLLIRYNPIDDKSAEETDLQYAIKIQALLDSVEIY